MLTVEQIESVFRRLDKMGRDEMLSHFHHLEARFPVDLTIEFLQRQTDERLRHLLVALCLQCARAPEVPPQKHAA